MSAADQQDPARDLADGLATLTEEERAALADDDEGTTLHREGDEPDDADEDYGKDHDAEAAAEGEESEESEESQESDEGEESADADDADAGDQEAPAEQAADADEGDAPLDLLKAELPADFKERQAKIEAREEELEQQYEDGDIDRATYRAEMRKVRDEERELDRLQLQYDLDVRHNERVQERAVHQAAFKVFDGAKKDYGIDYVSDADRMAELKTFAALVEAKNPTWGPAKVLAEAHRKVLVANDIALKDAAAPAAKPAKPAKPADPKADALARRKPQIDKAQPSLAQVPGGDGPGDVGSEFADLDSLDGAQYEAALERLRRTSPAKYEQYMAEQ